MTPPGGVGTEQPLVDHHCHGVLMRDLDRAEFESLLNEATRPSPLGTSLFDSMLGLAVRRWCAPMLGLEPHADPDAYLGRRRELGVEEITRRFLGGTNTELFLVDTGLAPESISSPAHLAGLAGGEAREIVRLERLAEDLLNDGVEPRAVPDRLAAALEGTTAVGAKSIAAYRTGLDLPAAKPVLDDVVAALLDSQPGEGGHRLVSPVLSGWLAWTALEAGLPLQFHVGYGDSDADLREGDPLLLTAFLRATEERGVPVLLLHNYPFHRHAAYLAQVFDHVFMDVGLAVHNTGALARTLLSESLELVPFGKMLFSSDAFGLPELYLLGARMFRVGLSSVLSDLVDAGEMGEPDAERIATLVSQDNARRVYGLSAAPS